MAKNWTSRTQLSMPPSIKVPPSTNQIICTFFENTVSLIKQITEISNRMSISLSPSYAASGPFRDSPSPDPGTLCGDLDKYCVFFASLQFGLQTKPHVCSVDRAKVVWLGFSVAGHWHGLKSESLWSLLVQLQEFENHWSVFDNPSYAENTK